MENKNIKNGYYTNFVYDLNGRINKNNMPTCKTFVTSLCAFVLYINFIKVPLLYVKLIIYFRDCFVAPIEVVKDLFLYGVRERSLIFIVVKNRKGLSSELWKKNL